MNSEVNSDLVIVKVGHGNDAKQFRFPKALLCSRSTWFRTAFQGARFSEGATNIVHLPEDCPRTFEAFQFFIFEQDLVFVDLNEKQTGLEEELDLCFKIWILGDKYLMPGLQNCVMQRICSILIWRHNESSETIDIPRSTLALAFDRTQRKSALRTIAVDYILNCVLNGGKSVEEFDDLSIFDGYACELFETQRLYNSAKVAEFPRYQQPLEHGEMQ